MDKNRREIPNEITFLVASILVVLLSLIGLSTSISPFVDTFFSPIVVPAVNAGNSVKSAAGSISSINKIRQERNDLLEENAILKAENSSVALLKDELELLKEESNVVLDDSTQLIKAEILSNQDEELKDFLIINRGESEGVAESSTVRIGNLYIGTVDRVTRNRSHVLLPTFGESFIEVIIIPKQSNIKNLDSKDFAYILGTKEKQVWKGVAIGRGTGIVVENIEANAQIKEGDHVIINDSDVGELLYLGDLGKINVDPSDVGLTVNVVNPINYQNLFNVMVEIEK